MTKTGKAQLGTYAFHTGFAGTGALHLTLRELDTIDKWWYAGAIYMEKSTRMIQRHTHTHAQDNGGQMVAGYSRRNVSCGGGR